MNLVFAGYKEGYCVLEYIICTRAAVNFAGVNWIHSLDRFTALRIFLDIVHSYNREWIYCSLDIVHIVEQTVQLCKFSEYLQTDILCDWILKRIAGQGYFVLDRSQDRPQDRLQDRLLDTADKLNC